MQINNLKIVPEWRLQDLSGKQLHMKLLPLLEQIDHVSKLTVAAQKCGLSYRLAWNILREAESFFGQAVTNMERGRGARLTELGRVLLQANQRIEARLHTQLESLTMELNSEVHRALSDEISPLSIYASHGYAVAMIPDHLQGYQAELHYHGPASALRALAAGECKIAGFTLPIHHLLASHGQYRQLLNPRKVAVRQFIQRQQGLMLAPSVVEKIKSIEDLVTCGVRFINRQPQSGTRELFDQLLLEAGVQTSEINGYDNHEYTHSAVAAHVATGMADVGFGVKAAAARFDLAFQPITEDRYFWAYALADEETPELNSFVSMLESASFQSKVNSLQGYVCQNSGQPIEINELFID